MPAAPGRLVSRKGRRIASWSLLAGVSVTLAATWAFRLHVEEGWQLLRLGCEDVTARAAAVARLGDVGGNLSVAGLLRVLSEDPSKDLRSRAAEAFPRIFPRLTTRHREEAALGLREAAKAGNSRARLALREVGPQCEGIYPQLGEDLVSGASTEFIAALVLFEGWPASRDQILRYASEEEPGELLAVMDSLVVPGHPVPSGFTEEPDEQPRLLARDALNAPGRFLALHHENPLVRAVGLSFGAVRSSTSLVDIDFDLIRQVFEKDPHRVPRMAALRIAGYLGPHEGSLDLHRILREEKEAELRTEAIQARDLWSTGLDYESTGIELWGTASIGLDRGLFPPSPEPWTEAEVESLEGILMVEKDPLLRDAASFALGGRHRSFIEKPEFLDGPPPAEPDLRMHEWGVWREGGDVLASMKAIDELPGFVQRSFVQVEEILAPHVSQSFKVLGVVLKPVVFFYARKPVSVFLRVGFSEGRPWTFYPEITDYTGGSGSGMPWEDSPSVHPPWLRDARKAADEPGDLLRDGGSGELVMRYGAAPWVMGRSSRQRGSWDGIGLEWCGLRVGYPAELETELEPKDDTPWWGFLRDVPSSFVALRSDREKFVFYDGAVGAPSPLRVAWEGASRQAIMLRADTSHLPAVFVIEKSARGLRGRALQGLSWSHPDSCVALEALDLEGHALRQAFNTALRAEGLTADEAASLVRTWTPEFFEAEGLRVITVLPRWIYDSMLPLRIAPVPGEIVRVGLIWRECEDLGIGYYGE